MEDASGKAEPLFGTAVWAKLQQDLQSAMSSAFDKSKLNFDG